MRFRLLALTLGLAAMALLPGCQKKPLASSPPVAPAATSPANLQATPEGPGSGVVREAQQRLEVLGYQPGPADGSMGPASIAALKKFQADHGLVPFTDMVDQKMLDALKAADPLITAVHRGDLAAVRGLLSSAANPNVSDTYFLKGWTPLMEAAYSGNVEAARLLLDSGATVDLKTERGKTALDIAIGAGCSICSTRDGNNQVAELLRGRSAKE